MLIKILEYFCPPFMKTSRGASIVFISLILGYWLIYFYFYADFNSLAHSTNNYYLNKINNPTIESREKLIKAYTKNIPKQIIKDPSKDIIIDQYTSGFESIYEILPKKDNIYLYTTTNNAASTPIFSLVRTIGKGQNIILPIQKEKIYEDETLFDDKKDDLVWRGSNTGGNKRVGIEKWVSIFDVGFNKIDSKRYKGSADLRLFIKQDLKREEKLKYKYILMLEGKSVPKGLKQALYSNSLIFMPKPTMESILLESQMIPWVHYVPVQNNLSDLKKKVDWARQNEDKVKTIINNATEYIEFIDYQLDEELIKTILKEYADKIEIKFSK